MFFTGKILIFPRKTHGFRRDSRFLRAFFASQVQATEADAIRLHDDISRAEDQLGLVVFPIG
jgi:hypothetical protein